MKKSFPLTDDQEKILAEKMKAGNFKSQAAFFRAAVEEWKPKKRKVTKKKIAKKAVKAEKPKKKVAKKVFKKKRAVKKVVTARKKRTLKR